MTTYKIKQSVISRATRKNEKISVPRKFVVRTFVNAYDLGDKTIEIEWDDTFALVGLEEFANSWEPLLNELYEKVEDNG